MANEVATTKRKVLVYTTVGNNATEIESDAKLWSELQTQLGQIGVSNFTKLKCVVGESKVTLESPNAVLPNENFTLFILPKKNKSGANYDSMSYREMKAEVKAIITKNPEAKSYFKDGSKNWTQLSTDKMRNLLKNYHGDSKAETVKEEVIEETHDINLSELDEFISIVNPDVVIGDLNDSEIAVVSECYVKVKEVADAALKRLGEELKEDELREIAEDIASDFDDVSL